MSKVKTGLHYMSEGEDVVMDMLGRVPMVTLKVILDIDFLKNPGKMAVLNAAKERGIIIVGRRYEEGGFDENAPSMKAEALRYFNGINTQSFEVLAQAFPMVSVWEGPNEPNCDTPARMQRYAEFSNELAYLVSSRTGRRAGIGSWAVGTPSLELWQHWGPALEAVHRGWAFLTRHSYGPLDMWYALRHRLDNKEFAKLGYYDLPVLITECGTDRISGAQQFSQPWRVIWGYEDNAIDRYWGEYLKLFENELAKDSYVIGAHLFTAGNGGGQVWNAHDVAHTNLAGAILANPPVPVPPPPPPEPTVVNSRPESGHWMMIFTSILDPNPKPKAVTWDMHVISRAVDSKGVKYLKVYASPEMWVLEDQTTARVVPATPEQVPDQPPVTPEPPSILISKGIVCSDFWVEKDKLAVGEPLWFNFAAYNSSSENVDYAVLAPRTTEGQSAKSWTNSTLKAGQTLTWRDHMEFKQPGTYHLYFAIAYGDKDKALAMQAPWDRLSSDIVITVV